MVYGILADVVVALHVAYVSFVVFGFLGILLGMALRWQWVRNRWFRCIHLFMIAFVAFEAIIGMTCPLTTWENELRVRAGQEATEGTFVGRLLDQVLFYNAPPGMDWLFTAAYVGFAVLVLATFVFAPVRWRRPPSAAADQAHPGQGRS